MEMPAKQPEADPAAEHRPAPGAPATYAAYAMRKNVSVRVSVRAVAAEPEELREEGYGHGV